MLIRHRLPLLSALLFLAVSPGLRAQRAVSYERGKTQLEDILPASPEPASRVKYGTHAHHILPKKFEKDFKNAGININDPKYGLWMGSKHHLSKAYEYNQRWKDFFTKERSAEEIEQFAKQIMNEVYGETISSF